MGFFGKLVKAAVNVAITPIDIVKDIATMGGALDDEPEPHTVKRVKKVVKSVEEAGEDIGDGDLF